MVADEQPPSPGRARDHSLPADGVSGKNVVTFLTSATYTGSEVPAVEAVNPGMSRREIESIKG